MALPAIIAAKAFVANNPRLLGAGIAVALLLGAFYVGTKYEAGKWEAAQRAAIEEALDAEAEATREVIERNRSNTARIYELEKQLDEQNNSCWDDSPVPDDVVDSMLQAID